MGIHKIDVARGIQWVEIPDVGLRVLCGCPADAVKHLIKRGLILPQEVKEMVFKFARDFNGEMQGEKLAALTEEVIGFLGIWWKYHILESDLKYAAFFREKGLR